MNPIRNLPIVLSIALIGLFTHGALGADTSTPASEHTMIRITTSVGVIEMELNNEKAPNTTQNFVAYAQDGFYNGLIFHRVIPGFMIQGGGFEPGMNQKSTNAPVENEADNGLKNDRGTIAMARTQDPHSATAQFFINLKDNDFLNFTQPTIQGWGYTVFGKVTGGMDIVDAIAAVETNSAGGHQDVPIDDVVIESVEIVDAK